MQKNWFYYTLTLYCTQEKHYLLALKGKKRTATVPEVPVMCIKNGNGLSADIFSSVSPQLLRCLVEAFSHVE